MTRTGGHGTRGMARFWLLTASGALLLSGGYGAEGITYPKDYRAWTHVKSAMITSTHPAFPSEGGLHHIYANAKAAGAYESGEFPDGSVVVYELLETREKDGIVFEGERRRLDVMVKDTTRYANTGGWGFGRFMGAGQGDDVLNDAARSSCSGCHAHAKDHGFVFSRKR